MQAIYIVGDPDAASVSGPVVTTGLSVRSGNFVYHGDGMSVSDNAAFFGNNMGMDTPALYTTDAPPTLNYESPLSAGLSWQHVLDYRVVT